MIFPGEQEAIEKALAIGATYGYGNLIAHLQKEWAIRLMQQGLPEKTARMATNNRTGYSFGFPWKSKLEESMSEALK